MLDHLRINIPIFETYAVRHGSVWHYNGDLLDLGLTCASRSISRGLNGELIHGDLFIPYESLPSSYTEMAFKFYSSATNTLPFVELKASPLKLLQGHNVYGFDDIELGAVEMLGLLGDAHPQLTKILNLAKAEVMHLDTTYFARLERQSMVQPVIDFLSNISVGHRKAKAVRYANYVAWGKDTKDGKGSRRVRAKAYGKFEEVKAQMAEIQKDADKGCQRAKRLICAMHDVLQFANATVRFEGRIGKKYMVDNGIPNNLWELIRFQKQNPTLLADLWHVVFDPILNTLKGKKMQFSDDEQLLEYFRSTLFTQTANGSIRYTKANNAYAFYCLIREQGYKQVKANFDPRTFNRQVKTILDTGVCTKAELQNLNQNNKGRVIPFIQFAEIKFDEQLPPNYVKPTSKYLTNHLTLVA